MNGGVNAQTDVPAARVVADADRTGGRAPDSVGAFASDLRELRHGAGNPTLHALARRTLISKSVISEAFAGRRLPTENTVSRLTGALGADPEQWVERRASLSQAGGSALATSGSSPAVARLPAPADRRFRALPRRLIVRVVMIVVLASTPLVSAAWWGHQSSTGADASPAPARVVASPLPPAPRADPTRTICAEDAVVAVSERRLDEGVLVTLLHSAVCDAVWGELVRLDGRLDGRAITIEVFPLDDRYGGRSSRATATGASAVNTRMLLGSSRLEGVCAVVTVAPTTGETSTTEAPLCV